MFWEHSLIESHGVQNDNNDKVTDDYVFVFDLQGVYKSKLKVHFRLGKEQFRNEMRRLINLCCHGRCNYFVGLGQTTGYPGGVLCTQYRSTGHSTHFFFCAN